MNFSKNTKLIFVALLSIFLMGFVPALIHGISANEATIGTVRLAIAAAGIGLIMFFAKQFKGIGRRDFIWLAILGLTFAVHWYMYFWSIKRAGASLAAIAVCTFGIHLLFVNRLFLKEPIGRTDFLAVIVAFTGVYIATPAESASLVQTYGFIVGILSGFLYACLPAINRQISHLSTNMRALGQFGFGLVGFSFIWPMTDWQLSVDDWSGLVVLGVMCTLGAHTLWNKASTELPGPLAAVIYYLYIPWAMVISVVLLDEAITWQMLLGAGLIIAANIVVALFHRKPKAATEPEQALADQSDSFR